VSRLQVNLFSGSITYEHGVGSSRKRRVYSPKDVVLWKIIPNPNLKLLDQVREVIVLNPQRADNHQCVSIKSVASGLTQPLRVGTIRAPVKSGHCPLEFRLAKRARAKLNVGSEPLAG
jgi:hypothetical protein